MTQVVTITPQGGISGLQRKAGKGLDLRQFGHASIERVSEIVWVESSQRWTVHILNKNVADHAGGSILTHGDFYEVTGSYLPDGADKPRGKWPDQCPTDLVIKFDDYDDAVAAEVKFLDALRVSGIF